MSLVALLLAYVAALLAIILSWKRAPSGARVRYRFGVELDTTSSATVAMVVYTSIADVLLIGGILLPSLRWWAVGLLAYTAYAGATALRHFASGS